MQPVIIGVDPHKLSATIEVVDAQERMPESGRFATDQAGYAAMRRYAKTWPIGTIRGGATQALGVVARVAWQRNAHACDGGVSSRSPAQLGARRGAPAADPSPLAVLADQVSCEISKR